MRVTWSPRLSHSDIVFLGVSAGLLGCAAIAAIRLVESMGSSGPQAAGAPRAAGKVALPLLHLLSGWTLPLCAGLSLLTHLHHTAVVYQFNTV